MILFQRGLVVESLEMRRSAGHAEVDNALDLRWMVEAFETGSGGTIADIVVRDEVAQSEDSETGQGLLKKGATINVSYVV